MLLELIVMFGSGPLSLDLITDKLLRRHFPRLVIAAVPQRAP
jgi:hypothetical protein